MPTGLQDDPAPDAGGPRPELVFPADVTALEPTQEFLATASEAGVVFDDGDLERLGHYLALLRAGNELANMTAITEPAEMWMKHIFDALTLLPLLGELPEGALVADVGSGAGLPGVPLAICTPHLRFVLIESTGKKAAFIRHAAEQLGLSNVSVLCERAEVLGQDWSQGRGHRERYDAVLARAVGRLAVVAELTVPLAKVGGLVLLTKGQRADEELAEAAGALQALQASHADTVATPTGRIVVIEKLGRTPKAYPRRPGEPARAPLK